MGAVGYVNLRLNSRLNLRLKRKGLLTAIEAALITPCSRLLGFAQLLPDLLLAWRGGPLAPPRAARPPCHTHAHTYHCACTPSPLPHAGVARPPPVLPARAHHAQDKLVARRGPAAGTRCGAPSACVLTGVLRWGGASCLPHQRQAIRAIQCSAGSGRRGCQGCSNPAQPHGSLTPTCCAGIARLGCKWEAIASTYMPARTPQQVRARALHKQFSAGAFDCLWLAGKARAVFLPQHMACSQQRPALIPQLFRHLLPRQLSRQA